MTIEGSGSLKLNALLNLIGHEPYIVKIYSYAKDPYAATYQLLTKKTKEKVQA